MQRDISLVTLKRTKQIKFDDKTEYDGEMAGDLPNGVGKAKYADGTEYVGTWVNGLFHGSGKLQIPSKQSGEMQYEGEFLVGKEHGLGVLVLKGLGMRYQGEFKDGERNGCGVEARLDGRETYLGQFKNGLKHGFGVIRRPTMREGQVVVEKWEEGARVGMEGDVAREFVGGLAEAAAFVAETALKAIAAQAEEIASACAQTDAQAPQSRSRMRRQLATTQRLMVPAARLQKTKKLLVEKNLESALELEQLKVEKGSEKNAELQHLSKRLEEQVAVLQRERDEAVQRAHRLEQALDSLSIEAEARVAAQELHVQTASKQLALDHEERMRRTAALYEDKLKEARQELVEARRQRDADASGVLLPDQRGGGGGGRGGGDVDPRKAAPKFKVVARRDQTLDDSLRALPSPACLSGPRRMATFGAELSYGMVAYLMQVERLGGEVDGYVGVMTGGDSEQTKGFALNCFGEGVGVGSFGDSEPLPDSKPIRDGGWVVLQLDADGGWLSLHSAPPHSKELGRMSCQLARPWAPCALCVHADSLLHVVRQVEPVAEETSEVLERVDPRAWRCRSKQSGAEYSVPAILHLMLRIQLEVATEEELQDLLALYKRGHQRCLDALWGRLGATQPQVAPPPDRKSVV